MKKTILQLSALIALTLFCLKTNAQYWKTTGNTGIDTTVNFLGTIDSKTLLFKTKNLEQMRIQPSGKIGMGIKGPAAKLNIYSTDYASLTTPGMLMLGKVSDYNMALDKDVIQARNNGTASSLYLNYYGGSAYVGPYGILQAYTTGVYAGGTFYSSGIAGVAGGTNASYALNVNASSSINGINVTDPVDNYALYCNKSGLFAGVYVTKASTTTGTPCIEGYSSGSASGVEGYSSTSNGVYGSSISYYGVYGYAGSGSGTNSIGVNGYGNYGIYGTTADNINYYAGYFVGDVYSTTGVYASSDQKLKQNIIDVSSAMNIIKQLRPKEYQFRHDGDYKLMNLPQGQHYGLIAQDVEKVLPNLVKNSKFDIKAATPDVRNGQENKAASVKSDEIDFKALNYTELIPIIIKGMQEQQAVIDQQQQQINQLQQMVQNMVNSSNTSDAKAVTVSSAYLLQNAPNPFTQNTTVKCYVPNSVKQAQLAVYNMNGQLIKSYSLTSGMNNVTITADTLSSGQYTYSLLADGKKVDSKSMTMTK